MNFIVGVLTVFLVINCLLLILLVLIQLPKKDAGAGMAFGGAAADALFGAGSGNVLTKVTKYATIGFFVLVLMLGYLRDRANRQGGAAQFEKQVQQKQMQVPVTTPQPISPPASQPAAASTNNLLPMPLPASTNAPEAPADIPAAPPQPK
jgi:preprotein translocase subunit SecG